MKRVPGVLGFGVRGFGVRGSGVQGFTGSRSSRVHGFYSTQSAMKTFVSPFRLRVAVRREDEVLAVGGEHREAVEGVVERQRSRPVPSRLIR